MSKPLTTSQLLKRKAEAHEAKLRRMLDPRLTEDEADAIGATPEEARQLDLRDAKLQRKPMVERKEADLVKLRAAADLKRDLTGRNINGVAYGQTARQHATATPGDDTDVAVLVADGVGQRLSEGLVVPKGMVLSFITREQFEELEPEQGFGEPGWERRLVFCAERLPELEPGEPGDRWDLRATIKAGFADPIHDAFKGRPRHDWESENDPANIDRFVSAVIGETTDRDLLESWLDAAGEQPHAAALRARLEHLFDRKEPNYFGGKDDRVRAPENGGGHFNVGIRG